MYIETTFKVIERWDIIRQILTHFSRRKDSICTFQLIDSGPTMIFHVISEGVHLPMVRGLPGVTEIGEPKEWKNSMDLLSLMSLKNSSDQSTKEN